MKPCGYFVFYPFDTGILFCWSFLVLGRYLALIIDFFSSLSCNYLFLWIFVLFFLSFIIILSFVVAYAIPILISLILLLYLIELSYISFEVIYKRFFILKVEQMLCQFVMLFLFWYFTQFHLLDVSIWHLYSNRKLNLLNWTILINNHIDLYGNSHQNFKQHREINTS